MEVKEIFNFKKHPNSLAWQVVNDAVMGGNSLGTFQLEDGLGIFKGHISLDNNGGFSSVRYRFDRVEVKAYSKFVMRLKGDGKVYQFRIKANFSDDYSYISHFKTTSEWQEVDILLKDMYPSFRGRKLDQPNFDKDYIQEVAFLIGNKEREDFKLCIERLELA